MASRTVLEVDDLLGATLIGETTPDPGLTPRLELRVDFLFIYKRVILIVPEGFLVVYGICVEEPEGEAAIFCGVDSVDQVVVDHAYEHERGCFCNFHPLII